MSLEALYRLLKKRLGKAKILAGIIVKTKQRQKVKIVFSRHLHTQDWLAILSTKIDLPTYEIITIYGKSWDIEVFFKMMKHHLDLKKETQLRCYNGIVGHTTLAMVPYIFLVFEQRFHDDPKTIGGLFFACSDEAKDLSLAETLQRLLALVVDKIRSSGEFAESVIVAMIDAIMGAAVEFIKTGRQLSISTSLVSIS